MPFNSVKTGHPLIPLRTVQVKNPALLLCLVLLIGFILRVYISFFTGLPHIHRDTPDYLKQADTFLSGGYINYFPNGYPLLIAFEKLLFGNAVENMLIWTNIILASVTLYFCWAISRTLF